MECKRENRRIRITKQAIRDSLIELMQERPISKISVKMICELADINRSTFYAHYKDQFALLEAVQRDIVAAIKGQVFCTYFSDVSKGAMQVLVQLLEFGKANASLIKVLISENGDSFFQNELMELAQEKILDEVRDEKQLTLNTAEYLKHYILGGMLSLMRYWLERDCADAPDDLAALMLQLFVNGMEGVSQNVCDRGF